MTDQLSSKLMTVDREQGRQFRTACYYDRQRKMSDGNIERLSLAMQGGTFIQGTSIHFCALPDGKLYLVNGNHTLEAIIACGIPQLLNVVVIPVPDMDAVNRTYMSFDSHKPRSWLDGLRASGLDQEIPLSRDVMAALGLIMQDFKYSSDNVEANSSRDKRFAKMQEYREAAQQMYDAISGAPNQHRRLCLRRAVLGVALETFRYQAPTAAEFWRTLAFDDGLRVGDPRKTLLRYLMDNKITGPIENFRQSRASALAWNAYYKGQGLLQVKPNSGHQKLVLLGTPWNTTKAAEKMAPARRPETEPDGGDPNDLFTTGVEVGPDGAKPVILYKH